MTEKVKLKYLDIKEKIDRQREWEEKDKERKRERRGERKRKFHSIKREVL